MSSSLNRSDAMSHNSSTQDGYHSSHQSPLTARSSSSPAASASSSMSIPRSASMEEMGYIPLSSDSIPLTTTTTTTANTIMHTTTTPPTLDGVLAFTTDTLEEDTQEHDARMAYPYADPSRSPTTLLGTSALPWPEHTLAYREFMSVKFLCEQSPFVFMRKDSLLLYYKAKHDGRGFTAITTAQAYQHLSATRVFVHSNTHFLYFTWKFQRIQSAPPASWAHRLRYLTFPATYPIAMLHALYAAVYGPHLTGKEFYHLCTQVFGKPQPCPRDAGSVRVVIPSEIFRDPRTWADIVANTHPPAPHARSDLLRSVHGDGNDADDDDDDDGFIPLEDAGTSAGRSGAGLSDSSSETVYSSESGSLSSSTSRRSVSPPPLLSRRIAGRTKRPAHTSMAVGYHVPATKRVKYVTASTRRRETLVVMDLDPLGPASPPARRPPPAAPSTLLSTRCSMRSRELLRLLRDAFLASERDRMEGSKAAFEESSAPGKLGKVRLDFSFF